MLRLFLILLAPIALLAQQPRPHAHNDYLHPRPLEDALSHGFGSVEADVFLTNNVLLVAHTKEEIKPDRTFESLYLAPLKARFDRNNGRVITNFPTLILLVDFKSEALSTWNALEPLLKKYEAMLTKFGPTNMRPSAVSVIISGNRPIDHFLKMSERLAAIDARFADLTSTNYPPSLMPLVSENWQTHFKWRSGPVPEAERERLRAVVSRTREQGRFLRFWAIPDNPEGWELMVSSGVHLVNTDKLRDLAEFLKGQSSNARERPTTSK